MTFIYSHPYITLLVIVLITNSLLQKMFNLEKSPLVKLILVIFSFIGQACSPFSGHVNEKLSDNYYYSKTKSEIRYSPMGNWFELGNSKIENADVASFKVLGRDFAKDKNHIFYKEHIIDSEVDYTTFKPMDYYCTDKNHVYIPEAYTGFAFLDEGQLPKDTALREFLKKNKNRQLYIVWGADPSTYTEINSDWAKDNSKYFYKNLDVSIDYESFKILNKSFCKDKNTVYALKSQSLFSIQTDNKTTEKLDDQFILDKDAVYSFEEYQDAKITDKLFVFPYKNKDKIKKIDTDYLQIDENIFYEKTKMENVDLASFQLLEPKWYAKDKNHVYCAGKIIDNADPFTFSLFEHPIYAKDKNHIYCRGIILKEADVKTFGPPTEKHSFRYRDKNHIFLEDKITTEE